MVAKEPLRANFGAYLAALLALGRGRVAIAGFLVAAGSLLEGIGIVLLVPLLGLVFGGATPAPAWLRPFAGGEQLALLLAIYAGLLALRAVIVWQRDLMLYRLALETVDAWRNRMVEAVAGARWRKVQELRQSRLEFAITSEVGRLELGSDQLLRGAEAAIQLMLLTALAFFLAPKLAAIALLGGLAAAPLLVPLFRASRRHGEALSEEGEARHHLLGEFMAGMKLAKAQDAEARYAAQQRMLSVRLRERALAYLNAQLRGHNLFQLCAGLAAAGLLLVGLTVVRTEPAVLSALLVLLARITAPAQKLIQGGQALAVMLPAVGRLLSLERELGGSTLAAPAEAGDVPAGSAALAFKGLAYRPPGREQPALVAASGSIAAGEFVALVGPSGSGKTTLADILLGLVEPDAGWIELDGERLVDEAGRAALRRQVGYVPQEPFLFDATIRENLRWASETASEDELWRALDLAEAGEFVRSLPEGLETQTGTRGTRLSGGERQRLCLARALLGTPRLLILDEPTSALDPEVEARLGETLSHLRGSITVLMIAHRLPAGLVPDQTWRIEAGRLDLA